jgi:hypothetical protein
VGRDCRDCLRVATTVMRAAIKTFFFRGVLDSIKKYSIQCMVEVLTIDAF